MDGSFEDRIDPTHKNAVNECIHVFYVICNRQVLQASGTFRRRKLGQLENLGQPFNLNVRSLYFELWSKKDYSLKLP